jgi:hypothetical protein
MAGFMVVVLLAVLAFVVIAAVVSGEAPDPFGGCSRGPC